MKRKLLALTLIILCCVMLISLVPPFFDNTNQIYWGAWNGEDYQLSTMQAFETQIGKQLSIWNNIQWWYSSVDFNFTWMDTVRNNGIIPMVSWDPNNEANSSFKDLSSILNGSWDSYLAAWGRASAEWGHPYFVRLMWEFNGNWVIPEGIYPYGSNAAGTESAGNTPQEFVAAWQYIVNHVRAAEGGKDYITWIWCPAGVGDSNATLQALYPGDNYVNWVGTDIYPNDTAAGFGQNNDVEIDSIRAVAPDKPFMICEIGNLYSDNQAVWWTWFFSSIQTKYSYVKGVCLWQEPDAGFDVRSYDTFKHGISSNYFASNNFADLNTTPITPLTKLPLETAVIGISIAVFFTLVAIAVWKRARYNYQGKYQHNS
jgi:Glycosyl hydrolase family 26